MLSKTQRVVASEVSGDDWTSYASVIERAIGQVVSGYVRSGLISPDNRADVMQDLHLLLFENWSTVFSKYDPARGTLGVYLRVYLRSKFLSLSLQKRKTPLSKPLMTELSGGVDNLDIAWLEEAVLMVNSALASLGLDTPKWRLLLKIYASKSLSMEDLLLYAPKVSRDYLRRQMQQRVESHDREVGSVHRSLHHKVRDLREYLSDYSGYEFDNESVRNLLFLVF